MPTPSWDLVDQDCSAIDGGFQSAIAGTATVTTATEDGEDCWKITCGAATTNQGVIANPEVAWSNVTVECKFKVKDEVHSNNYKCYFYVRDSSKREWTMWYGDNNLTQINCIAGTNSTGGLGTYNTSLYWNTARIIVNGSTLQGWYYFNGMYMGTVTYAGTPNSGLEASACGWGGIGSNEGATEYYCTHFKMSSSKSEPDSLGSLKIQGKTLNIRPAGGSEPLRFYTTTAASGPVIHSARLVSVADTYASPIRISKGGATLAIARYPTSADF